eukprot:TRINITY_DN5429_c0_g1_i1.p1 TRINITY_DN5429_c0_g1~~TRINITY_DN5429_c0_g1_i1.p1  ORF type:complete len:180 (+),score=38.43 TRINITY_DN5429_c0_g1_i1:78-617(+)
MALVFWLLAVLLVLVLIARFVFGLGVLLNDVTTDPTLEFVKPPKRFRYSQSQAALQKAWWPDLKTLEIKLPSSVTFEDFFSMLEHLVSGLPHWTLIAPGDRPTRRIQAMAVTPLMKFRDDVVIRVSGPTPTAEGVHVFAIDARSKSRIGRSDLHANGKRLVWFFERVKEAAQNMSSTSR